MFVALFYCSWNSCTPAYALSSTSTVIKQYISYLRMRYNYENLMLQVLNDELVGFRNGLLVGIEEVLNGL